MKVVFDRDSTYVAILRPLAEGDKLPWEGAKVVDMPEDLVKRYLTTRETFYEALD